MDIQASAEIRELANKAIHDAGLECFSLGQKKERLRWAKIIFGLSEKYAKGPGRACEVQRGVRNILWMLAKCIEENMVPDEDVEGLF